jgi:hypothetical protein
MKLSIKNTLPYAIIVILVIALGVVYGCSTNEAQQTTSNDQVSTVEKSWEKNNQTLTGKIVNDPKFHEPDVFVFIPNDGGMYMITKDSKFDSLCSESQKAVVKGDLKHEYGMFRYNDTIKIEKLECHDN